MAVLRTLVFLVFFFFEISGILSADGNSSFSFNGFGRSPSFDDDIALFGDSKVVNGGSSIQLTDSVSRSEGRVIYRKPIRLFGGKERNSASFSTYFSFSMSNKIGGVLSFVMVPSDLDLGLFGSKDKDNSSSDLGFLSHEHSETEILAFQIRTSKKGSRAGIVVGNPKSSKIGNLTSFHNFIWKNGEKLRCWIDYEASSKRIEVRLSRSGATKPVDPMVSYSIDLAKLWKDGKFMVGLSSINGNSSEPHFLHRWSFKLRRPQAWMHSQPLDPNEVSKTEKEGVVEKPVAIRRKGDCVWRMLSALVLGAVCGTLGAMLTVFLWTICGGRRPMAVVPEDITAKSVEAVVVDKAAAGEEGAAK